MSRESALLDRVAKAIADLDLGVSTIMLKVDALRSINAALRRVGAPTILNLSTASLSSAVRHLESAA